jgi:integrase
MGRRPGSRRRGGWRRKGAQLQVYVHLHDGPGGFRSALRPLDTPAKALQDWIDDQCTEYRRQYPRATRGTLAADMPTYLQLLVNRPALQRDRTHHLAWWCARFGHRSRHALQPHELETALNELLAAGAAPSTVKKYRTALYHLFTKLDGRNAPNPLRDVPPPREPDPLPRAIPYEIIDAIFRYMPETRYPRKIDAARAALVYAAATAPRANRSAIARAHGLSETMVRKIVLRHGQRWDGASQTKARLRLMAYVGLPPPQIRALTRADIDLDAETILAHGRKKGGGTRPMLLPLTPRGLDAARAFINANAFATNGHFSMSSCLNAWRRAITRLCDALEQETETRPMGEHLRRELAACVPYDMRHSYLTEAQLATGNIRTTQSLALHSDSRMTERYTLAAVAPELQAAARLLAQRLVGHRNGTEPPPETRETDAKWRKLRMVTIGAGDANIKAKVRNSSKK